MGEVPMLPRGAPDAGAGAPVAVAGAPVAVVGALVRAVAIGSNPFEIDKPGGGAGWRSMITKPRW